MRFEELLVWFTIAASIILTILFVIAAILGVIFLANLVLGD